MLAKSILIIDDNEEIRETYKEFFELEGYSSLAAENGAKGLEILKANANIGVVFVDMLMPLMDGVEFIQKYKCGSAHPETPVYIMTALVDQRLLKHEAIKLFHGILDKPVPFSKLLEIAKTYCH